MDTTVHGTREDRVRERAYLIWQRAGEPAGQEKAHWAKATEEIDEEDGQASIHNEPIASSALPTAEEFASPPAPPPAPARSAVNGSVRPAEAPRGRRKGSRTNGQVGADL
jgi:hypothetical protein